jgi:hypothetical protein
VLRISFWIGTNQRELPLTDMGGCIYPTEFRVHPIGSSTGMRRLACLDTRDQFLRLHIDDHQLVLSVGGGDEVPAGVVPSAIVEEEVGRDLLHEREIRLRIVDDRDIARLLQAHHPHGIEMRCDDRRHAHLVEFLAIDIRTQDIVHNQGLERLAVEHHVLRRPVATLDDVLVFVALELASVDAPMPRSRGRLSQPEDQA